MKRWIFLSIYTFILLILLTGCMKVRFHVTVNRDGTASMEVIMAADKSMSAVEMFLGEDIFTQVKADFLADGYEVEDYEDPEMKGFIAKKTLASMDEVSSLGISRDFIATEGDYFTTEKGLFHTTHHVSIPVNLDDISPDERAILRLIRPDISFALSLPVQPLQHNAHSVSQDGKTLEWVITPGQPNNIQVSIRVPDIPAIILAFLLAVFLPASIFFFLRNRKGNIDKTT